MAHDLDLDARAWKARAEKAVAEVKKLREEKRLTGSALLEDRNKVREENERLRLALATAADDLLLVGYHALADRAREALAGKKEGP